MALTMTPEIEATQNWGRSGLRTGSIVQVRVLRDGTEQTYDVVPGERPASAGTFFMQQHLPGAGKWVIEMDRVPRMGVKLQALTVQLADYFGVPSGVLVTEVAEDGAAWKAGLAAGDVLLDMDGHNVTHEKDVQEILTQHEAGDVVDVTAQRQGRTDRFSLTLQEQGASDNRGGRDDFQYRAGRRQQESIREAASDTYRDG